MAENKLTATQIFDGYYQAMKLSYPDNQTAHAVAREVRDIFTDYAAQQQAEHERVLDVLRDWQSNFKSAEASMQRLAALLAADKEG